MWLGGNGAPLRAVLMQVLLAKSGKIKSYGKEADMWSLGVIMYVVLSATPPYMADDLMKKGGKVTYDFSDPLWLKISRNAKVIGCRVVPLDPVPSILSLCCLLHTFAAAAD